MNSELKSDPMLPDPDVMVAPTEPVTPAEMPLLPPADDSFLGGEASQQAQQVWEKISALLGDLPEYVTDFFQEYRRPIVTIGLIFGAVVSVKLVLAILGAVNEIPLLSPTFELIGLTYSGWFVYRYLLRASNRQELVEDINTLKDQVVGKRL